MAFRLRLCRDSLQSVNSVGTGSPLWPEDSGEVRTSRWLICSSGLSVLTPIADSGFLLLRPIRTVTMCCLGGNSSESQIGVATGVSGKLCF